jgi:hypothetical protein
VRWVLRVVAAVVLFGVLVVPSSARAATPAAGALSADGSATTWTGDVPIPDVASPSQCPTGQEPFCDVFTLTVPALDAARHDVRVEAHADDQTHVIQLYVYGPDGTEVAKDESVSANVTATVPNAVPGDYSIRIEGFYVTPPTTTTYHAGALAITTTPGPPPLDDEGACSDTVTVLTTPPEVLAAAAADDGRRIRLDVHVLLDGVTEEAARSFFGLVAKPYEPLGIDVAPTFEDATGFFPADMSASTDLIAKARSRYPEGKVPAQWDIVEVLTNKDIQALGQSAVAGQADCLGGLAFKTRSYEVSEAATAGVDDAGVPIGPLTLDARLAAKVTAHEMGHLLGGQHHYANCIEGNDPTEELAGDTSPCTLMFNAADFVSLHFGTLNAKVVRGYALLYAGQNDAPGPVVPEAPTGVLLPLAAAALVGSLVIRRRRSTQPPQG